ncbi:hypothetical protein [Pseudomonas sp. Irchel 3A5]|uniref:hypothetical protein n=1 Tax=Pseudomonas sp. Irchel 3A5 TaxID=2008911 RepID=UPI00113FE1B3|nr:hypothetical protein [Pseudomonas sp. Irchel 3A5]
MNTHPGGSEFIREGGVSDADFFTGKTHLRIYSLPRKTGGSTHFQELPQTAMALCQDERFAAFGGSDKKCINLCF